MEVGLVERVVLEDQTGADDPLAVGVEDCLGQVLLLLWLVLEDDVVE